jgi:indolepyruvate ferredoxin oxidoreductase, beta subunit
MNKIYNIYFCGIGGQGVLTAASVAGWAALYDNYHVKQSEVHGMSQRGGSVESHIRFGECVYSPLIPAGKADYYVAFCQDEHDAMLSFKSENAVDILEEAKSAAENIKDNRMVNTFMLGVLSKYLPITEDSWFKAMDTVFSRLLNENKKAFADGRLSKFSTN